MRDPSGARGLVGRSHLLDRLDRVIADASSQGRETLLVAGPAGIGKTSLIKAATAAVDGPVGWGTCIDVDGAPGYWPWTQLLTRLIGAVGSETARRLAGEDLPVLATIAPMLGTPIDDDSPERARLLLMDATARFLDALASRGQVAIVLDDLQWADESSLVLLDFVTRVPGPPGQCVIGAYRDDELSWVTRRRLAPVVSRAHRVELEGLDAAAVQELIAQVTGDDVDVATAAVIHRRTGGHPFFVRELALLAHRGGDTQQVPGAVRDALSRRVERLSAPTRAVMDVASVAGGVVRPDVVGAALNVGVLDVGVASREAATAGVFTSGEDGSRFSHDLWRETILAELDPPRRVELHRAIGAALEDRAARGGEVAPSELARHFIAAVGVDGPERATHWALQAAAADGAALAFGEAAAQLRRLRAAVADAGVDVDDAPLVDVLLAESDALARAGSTSDARGLLRAAGELAVRAGDGARVGRVALAGAALGSRFAMRRDETVAELEHALSVIGTDTDPLLEAQLTAALARELQHSVTEDRPRAGPLSEQALRLGRRSRDPTTVIACLLARHDVLWTPGTAADRVAIASEIVTAADPRRHRDRHADGLLLLANAFLEQGSAAFRAALDNYLEALDQIGQPRHRYLATTRRACLLLLEGRLEEAATMIDTATALGERIREPDTGNVAMSQRLELVRARGDADELRAFAAAAVRHWTGAPVHAHAVAAGFHARAGDLDAAGSHLATVADVGTWRSDRSYLWSVFIRELAYAAVALDDRGLCSGVLEELVPLTGSCGVNGAVVAFAGSHAHHAGLLAAALGRTEVARDHLAQAVTTYLRLGAHGWLSEAREALSTLEAGVPGARRDDDRAALQRRCELWHVRFAGHEATVADCKGLADLARLLAAPNTDIHVLDLATSLDPSLDRSTSADAVVDRQALVAYRQRLRDLDEDWEDARRVNDAERTALLGLEREALLDEIGRVTGIGGRRRAFANRPTERARKAVSARLRDAIRRLEPALPELAVHLDRTVVTGTYCRYRCDGTVTWVVEGP